MEKLTADKAYNLLIDGVILEEEDFAKKENRWILHCIYTGIAAKRIADKIGVDSDYAMALGYVHDIGRKINHYNHPMEGYRYMKEKGYPMEAGVCLTHSFIDNDIVMTAGGGPKDPTIYEAINTYLKENEATIYDNIVQMCDLFCLETGFTTVEKRLLDISKRKGIYPNSLDHFNRTLELKSRLEAQMGCDLYSLFPEITDEDLKNAPSDHIELMELVSKPEKAHGKR